MDSIRSLPINHLEGCTATVVVVLDKYVANAFCLDCRRRSEIVGTTGEPRPCPRCGETNWLDMTDGMFENQHTCYRCRSVY